MCGRTSIGFNTFPSGHVAGSLAVALAVSEAVPAATIPMLVGAALISVSTVIGRYHYAVDGIAGVAADAHRVGDHACELAAEHAEIAEALVDGTP